MNNQEQLNEEIGKDEKGQTMVEYVLLMLVVVVIMGSLFTKLEEYLISNPDSILGNYSKQFGNTFSGYNQSSQGLYKYFTIRK